MVRGKDKSATIGKYRLHDKDTGSIEVQIALITDRISYLNGHLKVFKKDFASKHGLIKLVGKRRKFLRYLKDRDEAQYIEVSHKLGLRIRK